MQLLKWQKGLEIGIKEIDDDHRNLLDLVNHAVNTLYEADKEDVWDVLKKIDIYTKDHFKREEEYMEKYNFEYLDIHRKEHEQLKIDTDLLIEKFLINKTTIEDILNFLQI